MSILLMPFGITGVAEPAFEILISSKLYEIRRCSQRYAIETTYNNNDTSQAFRALAGYIGVGSTPKNSGEASIAMTAPVVTSDRKSGTSIAMTAPVITAANSNANKVMQFILPSEYDSMSKIPKPTNPNVTIKELPSEVGAIHRFSGWVDESKSLEKVTLLMNALNNEHDLKLDKDGVLKNYSLWQFNPPFTIPFLRRNEVWIPLSNDQVEKMSQK